MNNVRNTNITFINGVIVLGISNIILFLINYVCKVFSLKGVKIRD